MAVDISQIFNEALLTFNNRDLDNAEEGFRRVLAWDNSHVPALNLLTVVLMTLDRFDEAEPFIARAVQRNQTSDVSFYNYGLVAKKLNKPQLALDQFTKALILNSNVPETWNNRGTVRNDLRQYELAISDFDKAIQLNCNYAEAYANLGKSFWLLKRYDEALASYDKALSIKPDLAVAWFGRGNVFHKIKRYDQALAMYSRAKTIEPDMEFISGHLLHEKTLCCDWSNLDHEIAEIESDIASGKASAEPFAWLGISSSEPNLQRCAQIWNKRQYPQPKTAQPSSIRTMSPKIRVGYISDSFREHAISHLIVGVLENHDKSCFDCLAFDNGWDDQSPVRKRINQAMHKVVGIRHLDDATLAALIADERIDILVNIDGYAGDARMGVFSFRSAPIQVNYLGFPGTLGADCLDYIIADKQVLPPSSKTFYNEKVVYLPHSYQPNDLLRLIGDTPNERSEVGLPPHGFVFCCFNNNFKILPATFDSWMRILKAADHSVLWLLDDNAASSSNLRKEAASRGVDGSRIVFAPRVPPHEHLARQKLADLFLDTLPYNAHTTASDALWAELPLLTQVGSTFAGRVAASLLNAIQLPELITRSNEEYEYRAIELARNPTMLNAVKDKLKRNRLTTPLFDTPLFARHLEAAYAAMYQRYQSGLSPDDLEIRKSC